MRILICLPRRERITKDAVSKADSISSFLFETIYVLLISFGLLNLDYIRTARCGLVV